MSYSVYSRGRNISGEVFLQCFSAEEISVFESMRTYRGKIFREEEHLDRLFESAKTVCFSRLPSRRRLIKELRLAIQAYREEKKIQLEQANFFVRLTLSKQGYFVIVGKKTHSPKLYQEGVVLKTSSVKRALSNAAFPETKTSAYHNALLSSLDIHCANEYESVFLSREGYITEVRIGNLFLVSRRTYGRAGHGSQRLLTPPLNGILNGITRRFVIRCALQSGLPVCEEPVMRHDVFNAQEAFLTNTSWEILPVSALDGRRIGDRVPGPVTLKLQQVFHQKVEEECL